MSLSCFSLLMGLAAFSAVAPGVAFAQDDMSQPVPLLKPATPVNSMPRWSEFPVPPDHITPLSTFAADVQSLNQAGAQLTAEEAAIQWPTISPEDLHSQIVAKLDPGHMAPIDKPMTPDQINAYAAKQRARAVPPPVVP